MRRHQWQTLNRRSANPNAIGSRFFPAAVLAALMVSIFPAHAQNPSRAVDRAQLLRNEPGLRDDTGQTIGSDQGQMVSTANDKDLGEQEILKRQESYQPFTVSVSLPLFYTSNVALTPRAVQDDVIF